MSIEMFDDFIKFPESRLIELGLPEVQSKFLANIGLPDWCAPNMHFGKLGEAWVLLPIIEAGTKCYVGLGEDRDDRPIAIDLKEHSVWIVPRDGEPLLMARHAMELSQALYNFQACINSAVESDSAAFTENRIPLHYFDPFISWINKCNPLLIQPGSFWHSVLLWLGAPNNSFKADGLQPRP